MKKYTPQPMEQLPKNKSSETPPGFADKAQPTWAPPESQPEPRPAEPILKKPANSIPKVNVISPA